MITKLINPVSEEELKSSYETAYGYVPSCATNLHIQIDSFGRRKDDDDIQIFTVDGEHIYGSLLEEPYITQMLTQENGFNANASYTSTELIDASTIISNTQTAYGVTINTVSPDNADNSNLCEEEIIIENIPEKLIVFFTGDSYFSINDISYTDNTCPITPSGTDSNTDITNDNANSSNTNSSETTESLTSESDTQPPSLTILSDKPSLKIGETAKITFEFNEEVKGFEQNDIIITYTDSKGSEISKPAGAFLSTISLTNNNPFIYTALFTPSLNTDLTTVTFSVEKEKYTDLASPENIGIADASATLKFDTLPPKVMSITPTDKKLTQKTSTDVKIVFSEPLKNDDFTVSDLEIAEGELGGKFTSLALDPTDPTGKTYIAKFTAGTGKKATISIQGIDYHDELDNIGTDSVPETITIDTSAFVEKNGYDIKFVETSKHDPVPNHLRYTIIDNFDDIEKGDYLIITAVNGKKPAENSAQGEYVRLSIKQNGSDIKYQYINYNADKINNLNDQEIGKDVFHIQIKNGNTIKKEFDMTATFVGSDDLQIGLDNKYKETSINGNKSNNTIIKKHRTEDKSDVLGKEGNDILVGSTSKDKFDGGDGNDVLIGGKGTDTLKGGNGKDTFILNSATKSDEDTINDFIRGQDKIALDTKVFNKLPSSNFFAINKAVNKTPSIIYDNSTGDLYFDKDGVGSSFKIKIATLSNKPQLEENDFYLYDHGGKTPTTYQDAIKLVGTLSSLGYVLTDY